MSEILEVGKNEGHDEPFSEYDYRSFVPYINSFQHNEVIHININKSEHNTVVSESALHVQGTFKQTNGQAIVAGTSIVNCAILYGFEKIEYFLNTVLIDSSKNPGITSLMKGYPSFSRKNLSSLEIAGWDGENIIDDNGNFDIWIPLSMIFGFAEDFQKIVCNAKHELILTRSNTDMNTFTQTAAAAAGENNSCSFTLSKIEWVMPFLIPSDHNKAKLLTFLQKRPTLRMSFRSWDLYEFPRLTLATKHVWNVKTSNQLEKPRYVILGFQTAVANSRTSNASLFNHCEISNAKLFLNAQYFPYMNLNTNYNNNQYAILYNMFLNFQVSYYGKRISESIINKNDFKNKTPLIIFDCSHQNEATKYGPVDVRLEFESRVNIPVNTTAYCLIIHDRVIEYKPMEGDVRLVTQ